jgi:hypothetical protein
MTAQLTSEFGGIEFVNFVELFFQETEEIQPLQFIWKWSLLSS